MHEMIDDMLSGCSDSINSEFNTSVHVLCRNIALGDLKIGNWYEKIVIFNSYA